MLGTGSNGLVFVGEMVVPDSSARTTTVSLGAASVASVAIVVTVVVVRRPAGTVVLGVGIVPATMRATHYTPGRYNRAGGRTEVVVPATSLGGGPKSSTGSASWAASMKCFQMRAG